MFRGLVVKSKKDHKKRDFYSLFEEKKSKLKIPTGNRPSTSRPPSQQVPSFDIRNLVSPPPSRSKPRPKTQDRTFSKIEDKKKAKTKGYNELNPDYNPDAEVSQSSISVGDGGRSWRSRIQRRLREEESVEQERNDRDRSSHNRTRQPIRDYSILSRSKMRRPNETVSTRKSQKKRKRDHYDDENYKTGQPSRKKQNVNTDPPSLDPLFLKAVEAQMQGNQSKYEQLTRRLENKASRNPTHRPGKKHRRDDMFDREKEKNYDYEQGYQQYVVSHRNYTDDPTVGTGQDHDYLTRKSGRGRGRGGGSYRKKRRPKVGEMTSRCVICYQSRTFKKNLVVALGNKAWLGLPHFGQIVEGHCVIVPFEHTLAMTDVERGNMVLSEMMKFQRSLSEMFGSMGKRCIFLETITPLHLQKRMHTCIEVIPIPSRAFPTARTYFGKALREAEGVSSQRKVVEVRAGGISKSVPKDLPYFYVGFEWEGGLAYVIDEGKGSFPFHFGHEVLAGMLGLDELQLRSRKSKGVQNDDVLKFIDMFQKFDWTLKLDQK